VAAVEKIGSEILASIFHKNRSILNQQFIYANHMDKTLVADVFFIYLIEILEPIIEYHKNQPFDRLEKLTILIYKQILKLYSKHFLASEGRYPYFEDEFLILIKHYKKHIYDYPQIFSHLGNAILTLSGILGLRIKNWSSIMRKITFTDYEFFLKMGYIAAWVSGCASYREKSLLYLKKLDKENFIVLFDLEEFDINEEKKKELISLLISDHWTEPKSILKGIDNKPVILKTIGGFKGFDKPFALPPQVFEKDGQIYISDSKKTFVLFADIFGQQLISADHFEKIPSNTVNAITPIMFKNGDVFFYKKKLDYLPQINHIMKSNITVNKTSFFTFFSSYKVFIFGISGMVKI